ncbi:hypothetical protein C2845_PM07G28350 [Panicum miliaceum]|uniref:RING-type domain-containing protein n=1 Tax=Panicum miliaceum TaxID=4540 RepID=A0A3L6SHZ0_PANMI|nr:hypothetical protein C2845_PM07G28350 [Panicum miliaceum]
MPGTTSGMEASFWCNACSRLRRPRAQGGEPVAGCTRCGTPAAALEGIVGVVDAGGFLHACHPEARPRPPAPLPTVTVRGAGRDCAVCMEELEPGASAAVTPCEHAYHPHCVAPWLEARDTCPLCRAPVGGAGERDGLVACHLPGGRIGLGRRVAGRIDGVRILDEDGKLERARALRRGYKGVGLRARIAATACSDIQLLKFLIFSTLQ